MSEQSPARREQASPAVLHKQASLTVQQEIHQGPLPSPDTLERYEQVMPGLADTIVSMAAGEQEHRHKMEACVVGSYSAGPWLAFVLGYA